ncbi:MAG: nucleotidyltransferase [Flavobacteriaceae bacterium]|jgi:glucose-1-phosphate adenylyltransferase|nr:nucleotidyltransferase [Flavobacteriaceae bacterium]MBT3793785.1 nucleotidyltransferase [Flavobacteriaceae bacterium]MBT4063396.1 nucleotidyltransferase [Flavobacteriaceae bacterium]MBT4246251.1 nucleotidyltransferase [Flavobacteriaceae bacterium]MBT5396043.1 nucleotidyltransferase [Flavobacteriaceae bacterium]
MTDSIIIMAAGASSRMKKPINNSKLSNAQIEAANSKSKVLIEFGREKKPFISYLISNIIQAGFKKIYIVTSEKADFFRNNFKIESKEVIINFSIQYISKARVKPLGTADAVLQTLDQFPLLKSISFCVCNGDNLYSAQSLFKIRKSKAINAFIAYDRDGLNFSKDRISSFAIAKMDNNNFLIDIIEKPELEIINKSLDKTGKIRVSMNLFKFNGNQSFKFFKNCPINDSRNEKEIPDVLKNMISEDSKSVLGIPISDSVLDLTSKTDILELEKYLK